MYSWTYDAPSGTYKNFTLSSKIRMASIAQTKFMQFTKPEPGYGKKKGESITITRVTNIAVPTNGRLKENQRVPEDEMVLSNIAITVSEWGRAVPYTNLVDELSKFDMENLIQVKLRDQMALVLDTGASSAFKTGKIKATPTGATSLVIDPSGVVSTTATSNLLVYHVEQIRDYLYSTLLTPPYEGEDYIALVSTKAKRGVISDSAWEKWHIYTNPEAKYRGEIGRIENVRFIEIQNGAAINNSMGSGGVLGEAMFFGADPVAMAVAQDPELRAEIPKDFGRQKAVAWYGILEFGIIWDTANPGEANIVHVTSA